MGNQEQTVAAIVVTRRYARGIARCRRGWPGIKASVGVEQRSAFAEPLTQVDHPAGLVAPASASRGSATPAPAFVGRTETGSGSGGSLPSRDGPAWRKLTVRWCRATGRSRPTDIPRSGSRSVKWFCAQFLPEGGSRHMLAFSPVKSGASFRRLDAWRASHARGWV